MDHHDLADACDECGEPTLCGLNGESLCEVHFVLALAEARVELDALLERLVPSIRSPLLCGDEDP